MTFKPIVFLLMLSVLNTPIKAVENSLNSKINIETENIILSSAEFETDSLGFNSGNYIKDPLSFSVCFNNKELSDFRYKFSVDSESKCVDWNIKYDKDVEQNKVRNLAAYYQLKNLQYIFTNDVNPNKLSSLSALPNLVPNAKKYIRSVFLNFEQHFIEREYSEESDVAFRYGLSSSEVLIKKIASNLYLLERYRVNSLLFKESEVIPWCWNEIIVINESNSYAFLSSVLDFLNIDKEVFKNKIVNYIQKTNIDMSAQNIELKYEFGFDENYIYVNSYPFEEDQTFMSCNFKLMKIPYIAIVNDIGFDVALKLKEIARYNYKTREVLYTKFN